MGAEPAPRRPDLEGLLLALGAAVAFSMKSVLARMAYAEGATPVPLLTARLLLAAPFFALVALRGGDGPLPRQELGRLVLLGLLGYYLAALLDFLGLQHISAGLARLVLYVHPTFVVLIGAALRRRAVPLRQLGSMGVCYLGLAMAVSADLSLGDPHEVALGVALVLGGALSYALYLLGTEALAPRVGALRTGAVAALVSAGALALQAGMTGGFHELRAWTGEVWRIALALALLSTVLPVLLLAAAIARVGPARAATVGMIGPFAAALLGWALLGEPITALQVGGGAVVVAGLAWGARASSAAARGAR